MSAGITVQTPVGTLEARVILLNSSVDLPARAMVTNMKQWNGINGCLYCEDKGTTVGGDHLHRYWAAKDSCVERSHTSFLRCATDTVSLGTAVSCDESYDFVTCRLIHMQVCGVKGPTVLALHPCFDTV